MMRKPEKYPVQEILEKVGVTRHVNLDGDNVSIGTKRMQVFKHKGIKCVACGLEGAYFLKEKHGKDKNFHLNLYAVHSTGKEVMFTKDHILPLSKGGKDCMDNLQPMCSICNTKKGNKTEKGKFVFVTGARFIKGIFRMSPTIVSLVVGLIFYSFKEYVWAGVFGFLGIYPIASTFTRLFHGGINSLFSIGKS